MTRRAPFFRVENASVTASDDRAGSLGTVCTNNAPATFSYTLLVGPYNQCGQYLVTNTASIKAQDTGIVQSASWPVNVNVPCAGCTLSQGYWKTHSGHGPAPYNNTWALMPGGGGADGFFFLSGQTYHDVLWSASAGGNAYDILAKAYIAAELNRLNGASFAAVQSAFDEATATLISIPQPH